MTVFQGISLFTEFKQGSGLAVERLPASPGIYAWIYWPERGLRIGETKDLRGKSMSEIRWFKSMHNGTARQKDLRRLALPDPSPYLQAAVATGDVGFELYLVSDDPRLKDKPLRQEMEIFLHDWAERADGFVNWNRQRSWC